MKRIIPICLLCSLYFAGYSQVDYRVIGAAQYIDASFPSDFYIDKIEDNRSFQANLGIVNRGVDKVVKRALIEEDGFWDIVLERINDWMMPQQNARPVTMTIQQLYLWEHLEDYSEKGYIRLQVSFKEPGNSETIDVEVELSDQYLEVAKGHAPRLEKAFFQSLTRYHQKKMNVVAVNQPSRQYTPESNAKILGVDNFLDLKKEAYKPLSTDSKIRRLDRRDLLRYRLKSNKSEPYYALIKGDNLYIKANNYPGLGDYYIRVLEKGRYLFMTDEIYVKNNSELKVKLPQSLVTVGIIIDMETGIPQIVTAELMNELMSTYPVLQEHYIFKDILKYPFQLSRVQKAIAEINRLELQ